VKSQALKLLSRGGYVLGRSFFPFLAIGIVAGSVLWGPWVSLAIVFALMVGVASFS
jgi:hypothetical protein